MTGEAAPAALQRHLAARIRAEGPLSVEAFMAEALGHPGLGYYQTRDPLGAAGDFITAPEISQVFGELIGLWGAELWQRLGAPAPVILAELGPGRGTLMADALRAGRVVPGFAAAVQLHLVETSPVLRALQARSLAAAAPKWHDAIDTLPPGPLFLIANEFLDALPVRQLLRAADGWHERRVALDAAGRFAFTLDPLPSGDEVLLPAALGDAPPGSCVELRPAAARLAGALGARLAAQGGATLFLDYGHHPSACGETLQAVRQHRPQPVLEAPGTADLTAHVDFAAFAAAAVAAGARAWGPVAQGVWLRALGIEARAATLLAAAGPEQALAIRRACRRLIDPAAMGSLFKVLAVTSPDSPTPAGFAP